MDAERAFRDIPGFRRCEWFETDRTPSYHILTIRGKNFSTFKWGSREISEEELNKLKVEINKSFAQIQ